MGNSLHRFTWNLAQPRGTWVRFAVQNIMPIGARDGNAAPKKIKISTLIDFYSCYVILYTQLFCVSVLHLRWIASLVTDLLLRNRASVIYPKIFCATCRKNYAVDRKNDHTLLICSTFSIIMQNLGKIDQLAPTGDAKMMTSMWSRCMFLFVTLQIRSAVRSRVHSLNKHWVAMGTFVR